MGIDANKEKLLHITYSDSHLHENKLYNNHNNTRCERDVNVFA